MNNKAKLEDWVATPRSLRHFGIPLKQGFALVTPYTQKLRPSEAEFTLKTPKGEYKAPWYGVKKLLDRFEAIDWEAFFFLSPRRGEGERFICTSESARLGTVFNASLNWNARTRNGETEFEFVPNTTEEMVYGWRKRATRITISRGGVGVYD